MWPSAWSPLSSGPPLAGLAAMLLPALCQHSAPAASVPLSAALLAASVACSTLLVQPASLMGELLAWGSLGAVLQLSRLKRREGGSPTCEMHGREMECSRGERWQSTPVTATAISTQHQAQCTPLLTVKPPTGSPRSSNTVHCWPRLAPHLLAFAGRSGDSAGAAGEATEAGEAD